MGKEDIKLTKYKITILFSIIFLLLMAWSFSLWNVVQRNHEIINMVMASPGTGEELWKEKYRPMTGEEFEELVGRINPETVENNSILVITHKSNLIDKVIWPHKDNFHIWKPSKREVRQLILNHWLELQHVDIYNGKRVYILRDYGIIEKDPASIAALFNNEIIEYNYGDIRSTLSRSGGGGVVISPWY